MTATTHWRFRHAGRTLGPYPWQLIVLLHRRGSLPDTTLVQADDGSGWQPLHVVLAAQQAAAPIRLADTLRLHMLQLRPLLLYLLSMLILAVAFFWLLHSLRDDIDPRPAWLALGVIALSLPLWYAAGSLWLWIFSARRQGLALHQLPRLVIAGTGLLLLFLLWNNYAPLEALARIATRPDPYGEFAISVDQGGHTVVFAGTFGYAAPARLRAELARHPQVDTVVFDSGGGWMVSARGVARVLRQARVRTAVVRHRCASACTLAFESVPQRVLEADASLGFHSESNQFSWAASTRTNDSFVETFSAHGIPQSFIDQAIDTPPDSIWWPDMALLLRNGVIDRVRLDGRDLPAHDYFLAVVDRYFSAPEFAPLARGLKDFAPAHLQKLRQDVATLLAQDAMGGRIEAVTQQAIDADEELALQRAGDTAQLGRAALMMQLLQDFSVRAPELCYDIWAGQNAGAVYQGFTAAEHLAYLQQMGLMLQSSAEEPRPPPSDEDGADLIAQALRPAWLKYGDEVYEVPLALQQGRINHDMVCDMALSTYRQIHAMRPAEAGAAMRWLALGKSLAVAVAQPAASPAAAPADRPELQPAVRPADAAPPGANAD